MRHRFTLFFTILLLLFIFPAQLLAAPPTLSATSAILVDKDSGFVFYELNSHKKLSVASTTKIITGILVLEYGDMEDVVVTSQNAADAGGSELYLDPGEGRTVDELIYALLLRSANDAAVALAEYIAGSVKDFTVLMNRKAKLVGANSTQFTNPHGLHDENFSTAYDLSLIARYCLENEKFSEIVATKKRTIPWPGNPYPRELLNHNKLLLKYPKATGIKTGYTKKAGYCLVSSAREGNRTLIAVVLNSSSSNACY
ncbi:MAG: D-alanyl-D-alanine carboxypeptidase family protein, partial [Candidatus Subteraquimicrobiales bacterium]|nr:D-alanyl-D-alanine carboxypeptidase family protein [Candidatus Subteraquimicrobiales bacterium]